MTVSDAYCDGYEMYFTMTATTDNNQVNQKDYLLPEKSQQVYVNGEETGAELSLKKAEDGSFVGLWHISAGWLADKTFKDLSTVDILNDYLYLEVSEEYENVQMILTDADGNKLEKFGGTTTDPENGMYEIQLQFEQTDTNQIHVQVIDMDQSTNDNLAMVAEMTADLN